MIRDLKLKPNFADTIRRFEAWWVGEALERPPVTLHVKPQRPYRGPELPAYPSLRARWLDAEMVVDRAIAHLERYDYPGESFPLFWPNVGPEITGTLFGCELEYGEHTSWSIPVIHGPEGWERFLTQQPNFENPYWQTIERMTDLALAKNAGRYVVGITDLHGNYDLLASLRDPQDLCLDVLDHPDLIRRAGRHAADATNAAFERSYRKLAAAGMGATSWAPAYHEGPYYIPSSDFWCMLSGEHARDYVLPDIFVEMEPLERSLFHLDGPNALRHLDLLLALPNLSAVQWVFGDGQGPAYRWLDVYQRIQAAGKGMQIMAGDPKEALAILEALGPKGVWLCVGGSFDCVDDANAFLREVEQVSRNSKSEIRS